MAKPMPRELEVVRSSFITPHMLRVTLGGEALAGFPANSASAYIKLIFPKPDRPIMRTYTVRQQRDNEIDVDFMVHATDGPASAWAKQAKPGDKILVGGPGPKKMIHSLADAFVLAGDMTALPAISVNLSELPKDAHGYAVIEVLSEADIQDLAHPQNLKLHWLVNPEPDPSGTVLRNELRKLEWPEGEVAVWAACEFNSMKMLRAYFKQERQVPKSHLYISSYWKIGNSEDQHKVAKSDDARQEELG